MFRKTVKIVCVCGVEFAVKYSKNEECIDFTLAGVIDGKIKLFENLIPAESLKSAIKTLEFWVKEGRGELRSYAPTTLYYCPREFRAYCHFPDFSLVKTENFTDADLVASVLKSLPFDKALSNQKDSDYWFAIKAQIKKINQICAK